MGYLIAGYVVPAVIFGVYLGSLLIKRHRLEAEARGGKSSNAS